MADIDASKSETTFEEGPRLDHSVSQDDRQETMALDSDEEHAARYRVQHLEQEIGVLESAKTKVHDKIKLYEQRMDEAKTIKDTIVQDSILCADTIRRLPSPILSVQNLYSRTEEETRTLATKYELTCQLLAMNAEANMWRAQSDMFGALKCVSENHQEDIDGILENLKRQKEMS